MTDLSIPDVTRPAYFPGQRLAAGDLAAARDVEREMRWLHNRSLHDWGAVWGLGVTGAQGDLEVGVDAGLALDCLGRELMLATPAALPVPPVAGAEGGGPRRYHLTISHLDDEAIAPVTRGGVCGSAGAVRREERALLRWQDPDDIDPATRLRPGLDVILASIAVEGCTLSVPVSSAARRDAVRAQRPYVMAGATGAGSTPWRLWPEAAPAGVATTVSTLAGGFGATPLYQAHVVGTRLVVEAGGAFVVDGHAHVAGASASGFELRVLLPEATASGAAAGHQVTLQDIGRVVRAALERSLRGMPFPIQVSDALVSDVIARNGLSRIEAGQALWVRVVFLEVGVDVEAPDFDDALDAIAAGLGVARDALIDANGLGAHMALQLGQTLSGPPALVPLNPSATVLTPAFAARLEGPLGWHVHWLGVEA
jgi:hypothetical protein